ncbi:hypothetical protein KP509_26G041700 [Ceratopteris richardii]|nr:hypothetical protein KP509_26G041700 [Ceratopteris richardii]
MSIPLWVHGWFNPSQLHMMWNGERMHVENAHCEGGSTRYSLYMSLLKMCSIRKDLAEGSRLHVEIHKCSLLENNTSLGNMLLTMYVKCGSLLKAKQLLAQFSLRDVVSYNVLISGYCECGQSGESFSCYDSMRREGIFPDSVTYTCILKACAISKRSDRGKQIHEELVEQGLIDANAIIGNALTDMYSKCSMLSEAQRVLDKLIVRDVISWNALIAGYIHHKHFMEALKSYEAMQNDGIAPDAFTYACILKAFAILREVVNGRRIHYSVVITGLLEKSDVLGNALIDMYAKCGMLWEAHKVLVELPIRDVVSWSALITGYIRKGMGKEALDCYEHMQEEGLYPDAFTYACILKACGIMKLVEIGMDIHNEISKQGLLRENVVLGTALIDMYCKCGLPSIAAKILDELSNRNVISWSALITGYVQQGRGEEALDCFQQMRKEGKHPDAVTYACILKACGMTNEIRRGEQIHDEVVNQGMLCKNVVLGTALVDMYAKCGLLMKAEEVLQELSNRGVVSWNALITGYAQQGKCRDALTLFQRMRSEGLTPNRVSWNAVIGGYAQQGQAEKALSCFHQMQRQGIQPDSITFVNMLNACSHSGLVEDGQTYYENMKRDHGIWPELEHYTCLISLFAHTGHFEKAMAVMRKLPFHEYAPVWNTLMGACQKSVNVMVGKLAFQHALNLDEHDAIPYVYMENIYAAAGMHLELQRNST